jgi:hypothetical protein
MRDHARANALAGVHEAVPPREYFDRAALRAAPSVKDGALPGPPPPLRSGRLRRALEGLGNGLGRLASLLSHAVVHVHGRLTRRRGRVWTVWDERGQLRAILTLAYMRDRLNRRNLHSTYPEGELIGHQARDAVQPAGVRHFRTADGSWNNLDDPKEGAAGTRFLRNVDPSVARCEPDDRLLRPNPRELSRKLLTRRDDAATVPFLNLLAASWIQFQNHDWVSHGENRDGPDAIEIPLAEDDPFRARYRQKSLRVGRTQPDPTRDPEGEPTTVSFINEVTHWWDGSQLYGSDQETQDCLRSRVDGKLTLDERGLLPVGEGGVEQTGFTRNWWVGMSMFHTLFAREHNAICERLKQRYPHWDDDRLFQVARLVNAAVMARIHTVEWTPAILPNPAAHRALNANWFGLLTHLLFRPKHRRTRSMLNIRHPELGGVVGNPIDKHGSPYGLTEEFVEVYRLHSLLPESLRLKRHDTGAEIGEVPIRETRQAGSAKLTRAVSMADLFYSFGVQHPGQLVLNNFPRFLQELSIPGHPVVDLGAVDILRARERGVPRYNEFRRQLDLRPIQRFSDLTPIAEEVQALEEAYGPDGVEDLDLLIGTLAEHPTNRPAKFGFGETLFQIFILNATRRLQADRFYTDSYNEETYTKEGLDWIDDADLRTVLLRHHPELAATGLGNVQNAFEPWDPEPELDPARHPLREYAPELRPDPWVGDRYRSPGDVVDWRREPPSRIFRSRLMLHYFDRGIFLRQPKDQRVGGQIEALLRTLARVPLVGRWFGRIAEELGEIEVTQRDLDTLSGFRRGAGGVWFTLGRTETLVLFDREAIGQVLAGSPEAFGPSDSKLRGMRVFQPGALTITAEREAFRVRRALAEEVLGFGGRVHPRAAPLLGIVAEEVAAVGPDARALAWDDVDALCQRVALRVALGRWDADLLAKLEELMGDANVVAAVDRRLPRMLVRGLLARRDAAAHPRGGLLWRWLRTGRAFLDRASTRSEFEDFYGTLRRILDDPPPDSLVARLAAHRDPSLGAERVFQIPHWIFALRGTLAVHTIYTLALLAAHPETQEEVRARLREVGAEGLDRELIGEAQGPSAKLELLERCILEAGRLWPAVPLIVRQARRDGLVVKVGGTRVTLRRGQQVLVHNVAIHRDEEHVGEAPHAFRPERWERRGGRGQELEPRVEGSRRAALLFSDGPQTCPGRDLALLLAKGLIARLLLDHRYELKSGTLNPRNLPVSYDQFEIALERQRIA